jgi:hypothetical protein
VLRYFADGIRELSGYTTPLPINAQTSDTKRVASTFGVIGASDKQCLREAYMTLQI